MSNTARKTLWGLQFLGWGIIVSSLIHMHKLIVDYDFYMTVYADWGWLAYVRYAFSWSQRIFGIALAIGLLCEKNWARVAAIIFGIFVMLTVFWKHPYGAFHHHAVLLDAQFGETLRQWSTQVTFESLTVPAMVAHWLLDILFWSLLIFYITRPAVRERFRYKSEQR